MPHNMLVPALVNAWATGIAIVSAFMCVRYDLRTKDKRKKQQARYVLVGICTPAAISILAQVLLTPFQKSVPGLITLSFIPGIAFMGYAIWRYRFFILTPATAAQGIISTMSDALLLVSPEGEILTANQAALNSLGYKENEIGRPVNGSTIPRGREEESYIQKHNVGRNDPERLDKGS